MNNKDKDIQNQVPKIQATAVYQYSSPLPPPEVLQKYEQLESGMIKKIIQMTETQANHRRELEAKTLNAEIEHTKNIDFEARIGQIFAFILAILLISGSIYAIITGYQIGGSILGSTTIISLVVAFIKGRKE